MGALPLRARVWLVVLVAATAAAAAAAVSAPVTLAATDLLVAVSLVAMIVVVERLEITVPFASGTVGVAVGGTLALAAGIHFGPGVAAAMLLTAHLVDSVLARRTLVKSLTNICIFVLTTLCSAAAYHSLADVQQSPLTNARNLTAVVVAAAVMISLNALLIALIVAPVVGVPMLEMLRANLRANAFEAVAMPALAGLVVILARENAAAVLLMIFPLLAPQLAYRRLGEARRNMRETIATLADTIEARDRSSARHSSRVAGYAQAVLDELPHVPRQMGDTIVTAARIHDLGKIGVRDLAWQRPGPLTAEERREMERHAALGGEIVATIEGHELAAAIVRGHHERWDGTGYPDRLAGEQIPLGARIIAVADAFDAMTSDRAYRRPMSAEAALRELRFNSGSQFDPSVVAAFARAMGVVHGHAVMPAPGEATAL